MTDKELGTAAGEIFTKAFTLGYETGREYVPVGGMALTAEQVEDVEALVAAANPYSAPAARLRALFPATEPAEEVKPVHPRPDVGDWGYGGGAAVYAPEARGKTREELLSEKVEQLQDQVKHLSRVAVNAAEHGIKAPSGSLKPCGYCHSTEATLLHACTNCGAMTSDPWSHPTSAEPAEEETKAEACSGGGDMHPCVLAAGHAGVHIDSRGLRWNYPASSPVVPAPTETEWQTWQEVPEGVKYKSSKSFSSAVWFNQDHNRYASTPDGERHLSGVDDSKMNTHLAPFVAAEEG